MILVSQHKYFDLEVSMALAEGCCFEREPIKNYFHVMTYCLTFFFSLFPFSASLPFLDKSRVWQILYRTKFRFTCAFCSSFLGVENLSFWPRASGVMEPITDLDLLHFKVDFLANYLYPSAVDTVIKQKPLSERQRMRASRQYTSRVHVADICQALRASICNPSSG